MVVAVFGAVAVDFEAVAFPEEVAVLFLMITLSQLLFRFRFSQRRHVWPELRRSLEPASKLLQQWLLQ